MQHYSSYTFADPNPIKRWIQQQRFREAARMAPPMNKHTRVLDYGCADGQLFHHLENCLPENLYGFDPNQEYLGQCSFKGATLTNSVEKLLTNHSHSFDVIYCMEVCEHLSTKELHKLGRNIRELASETCTVVIGVPIESGLGSFTKNIFRLIRRQRGVTINKSLRALLGLPIIRAESPRGWIGTHVGFDHQYLEDLLPYLGLELKSTKCLPIPFFGSLLNNEIYFIAKIGIIH